MHEDDDDDRILPFDPAQLVIRRPHASWQHDHLRVTDDAILLNWRMGLDTYAIAQKFFVHESEVANRLPRLLHSERTS